MRALVAIGEDVNAADRDGRTALHHAAIVGDQEIAEVLLRSGARPNSVDRQGWTPLHYAASGFHVSVAETLLQAGAAVDLVDENGNTPLFRAVFDSRGRGEMIQLLIRWGADSQRRNAHGVSPLDLAEKIANFDARRWFG